MDKLKPRVREILLKQGKCLFLKTISNNKYGCSDSNRIWNTLLLGYDLRKAIPLLEEYEINSIKRKIELKYPETNTAKPQTEYQDDIFKEKEKSQEETKETANKMPFTAILVNTILISSLCSKN